MRCGRSRQLLALRAIARCGSSRARWRGSPVRCRGRAAARRTRERACRDQNTPAPPRSARDRPRRGVRAFSDRTAPPGRVRGLEGHRNSAPRFSPGAGRRRTPVHGSWCKGRARRKTILTQPRHPLRAAFLWRGAGAGSKERRDRTAPPPRATKYGEAAATRTRAQSSRSAPRNGNSP